MSNMRTIKQTFKRKKKQTITAADMMPKLDDKPAQIRMKDVDRDTYHCNQTRKMQISKIDPTIAFAFYLRNDKDYI